MQGKQGDTDTRDACNGNRVNANVPRTPSSRQSFNTTLHIVHTSLLASFAFENLVGSLPSLNNILS